MSLLPEKALMDGKRVVRVLGYPSKDFFDVLDTVGQGRARRERTVFVHRSRLTFLK